VGHLVIRLQTEGRPMSEIPLPAIEFAAFIGFALWLFLRKG
jgi:hypothetical protein